jgi:hypothetical protein
VNKPPAEATGAAEREQLKLQAQAEVEARQRSGRWTAGVQPHWAYQDRPVEWITTYLHIPEETIRWSLNSEYANHDWDGDRDPLVTVAESLGRWEDIGVESATGTGKTFWAACLTFWFLACFENSYVITAAPRELQLLEQLWKEIGELWPRFEVHFPDAVLLSGKIRMRAAVEGKETWAAMAFVSGVGADEVAAQRAAGFHREHMLIITEETPGVHNAIMHAFQHTRTDEHNLHLALGNPDHRNDPLHRFCFDEKENPRPGVNWVRISAFDHPNIVTKRPVVPGAIGKTRLERRIAMYGKGTRLYQSRIRGISPAEAEDAIIRWEWCVAAGHRYDNEDFRGEAGGKFALGVDVADAPEGDPAAIARWQGATCTEVEGLQVEDASLLGQRVYLEAMDRHNPVDPRYIGIDSVGVGASCVNELRRCGLKVRFLSGGTRAVPGLDTNVLWSETEPDLEGNLRAVGPRVVEAERFNNLRSQVWWRTREDLRLGNIALPNDEELWQELCTPTYTTKGGKIIVESKEEIIKRLKRSPNKGDACCYGNFVRRRGTKKKAPPVEMVTEGPNVHIGLERRLERARRQAAAEEARIQRHYRNKARRRKRGLP